MKTLFIICAVAFLLSPPFRSTTAAALRSTANLIEQVQ